MPQPSGMTARQPAVVLALPDGTRRDLTSRAGVEQALQGLTGHRMAVTFVLPGPWGATGDDVIADWYRFEWDAELVLLDTRHGWAYFKNFANVRSFWGVDRPHEQPYPYYGQAPTNPGCLQTVTVLGAPPAS